MQPFQINSWVCIGRQPFVVDAAVVYIHTLEMALCTQKNIGVPCADDFYQTGSAGWEAYVAAPGMPWLSDERTALDFLIELLPKFTAAGTEDAVYRALVEQRLTVAPFAYPVLFRSPDKKIHPGLGRMMPDRTTLLLLRHMLFQDPLGLLSILYHEGLHAVVDADEKQAHQGQLELCKKMFGELGTDTTDRARVQQRKMLGNQMASLERAIARL